MGLGLPRRSMGPAIAIALFCVLLIGGIAVITVERIGYERGEAVREAVRENANLAIFLERHAAGRGDLAALARRLGGPPRTLEIIALDAEGAVAAAARSVRDGSLVSVGPDGVARYISYRVVEGRPEIAVVSASVQEALAAFDARSRQFMRNAWAATIAVVLVGAALITAWVSLGRSEQQFRELAGNIPQAFWMTDLRRRRAVYLSPGFRAISGLASRPAAAAWEGWKRLVHPEDRGAALEFYADAETLRGEIEHRIVRPDGAVRWVRARGFPVHEATGDLYRIAGTLEDVTDARAAAEKLQHQAQYDTLTDLPNRLLCYDRLTQALAQARRRNAIVAVLFVDLDRFKTVNDTLGHAVGDGLLREAARRLQRCVRAGDTVARVGGDEFAVVLNELARPQDAGAVAQKMIDAMAPPMQIEHHEVFTSVSVGIAAYPGDGSEGDTLMRNADAAMFKAKHAGRNRFQYYTAAMNERAMEDLLLENDLRRALERNEFELYYQPKQHLASGAVSGLEALLRWRHPGRGLVQPALFVPLLEDSGLIVKVGDWAIRAACRQLRDWQKAAVPVVPVAVNLCAKQFLHHNLVAVLEEALVESAIPGSLLQVEVTESDAMQRPEEVVDILTRLKALGVRVAIDDFGTGYSSLSYLKRLPIDTLKLDRSFVTGLPDDAEDAAISRAVISMAHSLGLQVIAEGVENEAQRAFLEALGCDELQGYLGSDALPAAACARFLAERARLAA
jgi:diguanylate cyclase (GGDEF)-like protein/PAS domain S-box-containing protein